MLPVTTTYDITKTVIETNGMKGQVYGYPINIKDVCKILDNPDINEYIVNGDEYDVAFDECRADILLRDLLYKTNPWLKKKRIDVYVNWISGDGDDSFFVMIGIMYKNPNKQHEDLCKTELEFLGISHLQESLNPSSFYEFLINDENIPYYTDNYHVNARNIQLKYTPNGEKLIKHFNCKSVDTRNLLNFHKISAQTLWDNYFHNLPLVHLHDLIDLQDVINIMFDSKNISSELPSLVCTYIEAD